MRYRNIEHPTYIQKECNMVGKPWGTKGRCKRHENMKRVVALMGGTGLGTAEAGGGAANFRKASGKR